MVYLGAMRFSAPPRSPASSVLVLLILSLTLGGASLAAALLLGPATVAYSVSPEAVRVDASVGPFDQGRSIRRADITRATPVDLRSGRRVAGTALPDYCQGRWRYDFGVVWQATTCAPTGVLIETAAERVVVTPRDSAAFIAALSAGQAGEFLPVPGAARGNLRWFGLIPIAIFVLFAALFFRIRRIEYAIEHGALQIPAHLRTLEIPLAGATVKAHTPARIWRVAGTGLPQLYLGLYRLDGRNMHVAATRTRDGVLIEGERIAWITPEDPARFVEEAVRAGARRG